ncbi:sodium:alanine symporter family protein [Persicobacter sp. CCB-QB2]|uniref:alanine/glycine:cation symporter family protein n=1 Tax=Persicobacter sp. CCB-QB2 TaxID=1561025 RepID=UPI0009E40DE5|nr:alanine/glycine:cation symporter family protein [Persicobacter sp. CCB-QB2]
MSDLLQLLPFFQKLLQRPINLQSSALSIDERINQALEPFISALEKIIFFTVSITEDVSLPIVVIWLFAAALIFTVYFKGLNFRGFKHAFDVIRGKYDEPDSKGEVSHFQALTAALSGTVGIGNIAGVALAISIGGPGATFWMIMAGIFGMATKFVECTLAVKYRIVHASGEVSGGPMYYLWQGLTAQGKGRLGKGLALAYAIPAVGCSFGGGCMIQINQATKQLINVTGGEQSILYGQGWIFGLIIALITGSIIIGGIKSIAKVTSKIVPMMVVIYMTAAFFVIGAHWTDIPAALMQIISQGFNPEAVAGGFIGVLVIGVQRAAFSNEAGIGQAATAHAPAKTEHPVSEGYVGMIEPFVDTVLVCTMTALVIILTNSFDPSATEGVELTSRAFGSVISWFPIVLSVAVILFALSTMISCSYYGLKAWTYIFGENKVADLSYKLIFCIFVVIGSSLSLTSVFRFGDAMAFAMCAPNIIGLYLLAPVVKRDLKEYKSWIKTYKPTASQK